MAAFTFDQALHEYRLDGQRLPSVTQILKPIAPDFSMVPPDVLERKRQLGTAVHLACELDDDGELDEESLDDALRPYLGAWRKFKAETGAAVLMNEQRLYHPRLRYAGTLDRLAELHALGGKWLIDLKTSLGPAPSYGVQTAAYVELLQANASGGEFIEAPRRGTLHLFDDGSYKLHEHKNPNDLAAFRALLTLHHWKESNP